MPLIPIAIWSLIGGTGFAIGTSFKDTFGKFFWLALIAVAMFFVWKII
jgi:hypothetical protein